MAHKKAAGSVKNIGGSQPKYLGIKIGDGDKARPGTIIVRQRGTRIIPGAGVGIGKDHTLFALKEGTVKFANIRRKGFDGQMRRLKKVVIV